MIGTLLDGRYQIVNSLSAGGFGQTYLAQDTKRPGNPWCVVKQLHPPRKDPATIKIARQLFAKEAETLEKLGQHDQIPRLFAYFEERQEFYLIQEFVSGISFEKEIQAGHPWSEAKTRQFLIEVLEILAFVHGQGVIHRDIKPGNLMHRQSDGKIILIDFGAVKEIATQLINSQGQVTSTIAIGTAGYMPLEQFNGHPQFNSDLHALGVVAIQALTGLSIHELLELKDPNNPSTGEILWHSHAQVTSKFAAILNQMVRADCRQRYQTATEALVALGSVAANSTALQNAEAPPTILQSPPTPRKRSLLAIQQRLRKIPRRVWLATVGGLAALLIGGGGFATWQHHQNTTLAVMLLQQAQEKISREDYSAAITDLNQLLQLQPQNGKAYYLRGLSLRSSDFGFEPNGPQRVIADYTQALRYLEPQTPRIGMRHEIDSKTKQPIVTEVEYQLPASQAGVRKDDRITEINGQPTVNLTTVQVSQLLEGEANTPITLRLAREGTNDFQLTLKRVLATNSLLVEVYGERSFVRQIAKDYEGAIQDARKAQEMLSLGDSRAGLFRYYEGLALEGQGKWQEALSAYSEAITTDPKLHKVYLRKAGILRESNKANEAIEVYTEAIKVAPKFVEAYYERGITFFNHLKQKQSAVQDFDKVIELHPENDSPAEIDYLNLAYINRGRALIDLGNPKAAIDNFDQMLSGEPFNKDLAYIFRGIARDKLKDYSGAIADFTQVIDEDSLSSNQQVAYNFRGLTYLRIKDIPNAIRDFTKAIEVTNEVLELTQNDSDDTLKEENERAKAQQPSYYLSRGRAYVQARDNQRAIADFKQASKLAFEQKQLDIYNDAQAEIAKLNR
jgi:serine/threonine protein kinase/lipoprotein NlpI